MKPHYHKQKRDGITVRQSKAGLGLFAQKPFARGDFVVEYTGEHLTPDEADRRGGKYLFTVDKNLVIDGKERKNIARYLNHSCVPNCFAESDEEAGRVRIYAKKKIAAGEELMYHYGKEYFDEYIGADCRCTACQTV